MKYLWPLLALAICNGASADADLYRQGLQASARKDYGRALPLLQRAADGGSADAAYYLALLYHGGNGLPRDYGRARHWYERAAAAGHPDAIVNLGDFYYWGRGGASDYAKARCLFARVAHLVEAQFYLGLIYGDGQGVPADQQLARLWYEQAARGPAGRPGDERFIAAAQFNLGAMYLHGRGVARDSARAKHWFKRAAAAGHGGAKYALASHYEERGDYGRARRYYEEAAAAGDPFAFYDLGRLYENGLGVARDQRRAVRHWRRGAALATDSPAARELIDGALRRHWLLNAKLRRSDD